MIRSIYPVREMMDMTLNEMTTGFCATYRFINAWRWIALPMAQEIHLRCTGLIEAARKGVNVVTASLCTEVMIWILSMCGTLGLDLNSLLAKRFPGVCPYCKSEVCTCDPQQKPPIAETAEAVSDLELTLTEWQSLFERMYGAANKAKKPLDRAAKAAEEAAEVVRAIQAGQIDLFVAELADLVTRIIAIANRVGFNLEEWISLRCPDFHCSKCRQRPCRCDEDTVINSYRPGS